ncbi:MAG: HEAT repeat domain-containing protein [Planctomycetes bacterium]|nr:HEAT repeat domain-containing protein [Planctomycetota bacterium]
MRKLAAWAVILLLLVQAPSALRAETVDALIKGLKSENPEKRIQSAEALKDLGPLAASAVPALIEALHGKDLAVQHEALLVLEKIGPAARRAVGDLVKLLENQEKARLHSGAVDALGAIGRDAAPAIPALQKLLSGKDVHLATAAGVALTHILPPNSDQLVDVVKVLSKSLENSSPEIRNEAIFGLGESGAKGVPVLSKLVQGYEKNPELAWQAAAALSLMGPAAEPAIPDLVAALASKHEAVASQAAMALGAIGPKAKLAVPGLQALLVKGNLAVKEHAASALGNLGPVAAPAVNDLAKLLKDQNEDLRGIAATALGKIGPAAEPAVPALVAALDDERGPVALHAADALGRIGPNSVSHLGKALSDPRRQMLAAMILAEMGASAKSAIPALEEVLTAYDSKKPEGYHDLCREVLLTLARMGAEAKSATPTLLKILSDEKHALRPGAAWALANIGAKEAIPYLNKALETDDGSRLHYVAPIALMLLEPENEEYVRLSVPNLTNALTDGSPAIRREAAMTLARIGPKAAPAVDELAGVLNDRDPALRNAALLALAAIGPDATGAISKIVPLLEDSMYPVRYAAIFALGKIGRTARGALPVLEKNLQDPDSFLQTASAWALLQIDSNAEKRASQVLKPLVNGLSVPDPRVRIQVVKALGILGAAAKPALKDIEKLADDANPEVKKAVAETLKKING